MSSRLTVALVLLAAIAVMMADAFAVGPRSRRHDDQDEPLRLKTDLVSVNAAVTDRNGRPIKSLKADDFVVYEDGIKQKIGHFSATEEPFTLMLLLDTSGSTRGEITLIKRAAKNFLSELRSNDRVGVIAFSNDVELLAGLTGARSQVEAAIDQLDSPEGSEGHQFSEKTGTSFYDALYLAVEESPLKSVEGRKAIVCMSDGVDSTSKLRYAEVAKLVEKSEASVYFLEVDTEESTLAGLLRDKDDPEYINFSQSQIDRYYDEYEPKSLGRYQPRQVLPIAVRKEINAGLYRIARRELRELSEHTGGRVYQVRSLADLDGVYKQVADDLRSQYLIGYYPTNETRDGRWRTIRVEARRQGATVRARSGYWAPGK